MLPEYSVGLCCSRVLNPAAQGFCFCTCPARDLVKQEGTAEQNQKRAGGTISLNQLGFHAAQRLVAQPLPDQDVQNVEHSQREGTPASPMLL